MRFAAIADVHGNVAALEAVLADIAALGISDVVNLGDHFSGPLAAGRTGDLLLQRDFPSIRGNHDRWLLEQSRDEMGPSDAVADADLRSEHKAWLAGLPATLVYQDEVFLCHGTPTSDTTYWLESVSPDAIVHQTPIEQVEREAQGVDFPLILCGHTHIPRAVRLRDGRYIVNPGSVGVPGYDDDAPVYHVVQTGNPDACYAVLEKVRGQWQVMFRYVPYDTAPMVTLAKSRNRPEWARALESGWVR
ncbi:MAG: metallophosphoesterase family protein [Pseudomonadota bacterium]